MLTFVKFHKIQIVKFSIAILLLFLLMECYLRYYWGFCDSVLMTYSSKYEYIEQPNQNRFRFRKHVFYNAQSMRSEEVDSNALIILGFGDSIFNGGVQVDQDSIASSILTRKLTYDFGRKVQVLNVSAGSWGPDNCFEYLKERGDFNAKAIVLVVSSHDAYDVMDFKPVIDRVDRYESHQYKLATWELINRYLVPKLTNKFSTDITGVPNKSSIFNPGFAQFTDYCKNKNKPFIIYLNPDTTEVNAKRYHVEGEQILNFCKSRDLTCIEGLSYTNLEDYRGVIHLNESGQRKMAAAIQDAIVKRKQEIISK